MAESNSIAITPHWKRNFFTIWTGQAFSLFGSQLVQFALIWYLTKTTGSATILATASLVGLLPHVFLSPLVGVLVDRWNRRRIMIFADSGIALATLGLLLIFALGQVQPWMIFVLLFLRSIGGGFHGPAMNASTTLMVPQSELTRIQGLNQSLWGAMNIIAAPVGALLVEALPMWQLLSIDVVTAMIAVVPLLFIAIPQPERKNKSDETSPIAGIWSEMKMGLKYTFSWKGLFLLICIAMLINLLLSPAYSLLPILVTKHFNGGALQLGWIESANGLGMLAGGILLGVWGGFKKKIVTTLAGAAGLGLTAVLIGLVPGNAFVLGLGIIFLNSLMSPLTNGPLFAILQTTVEPDMQGRVFTLLTSLSTAMMPLGLAIAGPMSDWLGVQSWFIIGGIFTMLAGIAGFFVPVIMTIEEQKRGSAADNQPA